MPVVKKTLFTDYPLFINHWEGFSGWSERHTLAGYDPAVTTINSVKCFIRVKEFVRAPILAPWAWGELAPCEEYPYCEVIFELNGLKVFQKKVHVDKDVQAEGKAYYSTEENIFRIAMTKVRWLDDWKMGAVVDAWVEIDYTGTAVDVTTQPPPAPTPETIEATKLNPTYPWTGLSMPFMGEFSSLFLIVIVVMIFVLIITAIRRS